jgi:hypothetical protein
MLRLYVWQQVVRVRARVVRDEAGEGVISAAIAVLVMAFLGVLMWQLFGDTLRGANDNVNEKLGDLK